MVLVSLSDRQDLWLTYEDALLGNIDLIHQKRTKYQPEQDRSMGQNKPPSLQTIRNRTSKAIIDACQSEEQALIHAPPSSGKTTSVFKYYNKFDHKITYLTLRSDLYEQAERLARGHNLTWSIIPAPQRNCPTFRGDHSDYMERVVNDLYDQGISGTTIHHQLNLSCEPGCKYLDEWDSFNPDSYDVIIGNAEHAYVEPATADRIVIFDEFPASAFIEKFEQPTGVVSEYFQVPLSLSRIGPTYNKNEGNSTESVD